MRLLHSQRMVYNILKNYGPKTLQEIRTVMMATDIHNVRLVVNRLVERKVIDFDGEKYSLPDKERGYQWTKPEDV